ncbi:MAG: SDR family oxidoreductase [Parcubacteria group bacterium]|nr:SDR family oxidoreductase [Parcubacteria group bacterium]
MKTLSNKIALVVGASGGIGSAIVKRLCDEGMKVIMTARNRERLEEKANELNLAAGTFLILPADASVHYHAQRLFDEIKKRFKRLDVVVISSGGYEPLGLGESLAAAAAQMEKATRANLLAVQIISYGAVEMMKKRNKGFIINISSQAAVRRDLSRGLAYGPAKAGAYAFMQYLDYELKRLGLPIRVLDIQPATVNTPENLAKGFIRAGTEDMAVQPEEIAQVVVDFVNNPKKFRELGVFMKSRLPDF